MISRLSINFILYYGLFGWKEMQRRGEFILKINCSVHNGEKRKFTLPLPSVEPNRPLENKFSYD
jgi:hypothetical protein